MLYKIAPLLQLAGLLIVPIGIAGNLAERHQGPVLDLKQSLRHLHHRLPGVLLRLAAAILSAQVRSAGFGAPHPTALMANT